MSDATSEAESRIAAAVEVLSWMPGHDGDDPRRVEDDYRHRAQLADEALTILTIRDLPTAESEADRG